MGRAVPMMAAALATQYAGLRQVVLVSNGSTDDPLAAVVTGSYLPFALTLSVSQDRQAALSARLPFLASMHPVNGMPAAYVCRDFTCRAPVTSEAELRKELE